MKYKSFIPLLSFCLILSITSCKKSQVKPSGPIRATDVSVGADGSVFIVGADSLSTGGYTVSKVVNGKLTKLPDCNAVRIAVSPDGIPWVVTRSNNILKYNGSSWDHLPGTATDIGIGANGDAFAIGTQFGSVTGGYNIMRWNGSSWDTMPDCAGIRIAVAPDGIPWAVNKSNIVFQYGGTYLWNPISGVSGNDIGIGAQGSVFVSSNVSANGNNAPVYNYVNGIWTIVPNVTGTSISVSPKGSLWWIDSSNILHSPQ